MNRLTLARYREKTSSSWNVNSGRYDVTNLVYDRNGNIKSLQRKGMTNPVADPIAYGVMDNLTYTYENAGRVRPWSDPTPTHQRCGCQDGDDRRGAFPALFTTT
ncbi:MAG: hypothetical protein SF052_04310 [Bacteroidia bacterium]|nr:hypothetical protein [Bacteroidia bacterium]